MAVFPSGTEEFFASVRERLPSGLSLELAADDSSYHEVAVHYDVVAIATVLVKLVAAPVVVTLISEFLKKRLGTRLPQSQVKAKLIVQHKRGRDARSVDLTYDGPAAEFERTMKAALDDLSARVRDEHTS